MILHGMTVRKSKQTQPPHPNKIMEFNVIFETEDNSDKKLAVLAVSAITRFGKFRDIREQTLGQDIKTIFWIPDNSDPQLIQEWVSAANLFHVNLQPIS